MCLIEFAVLGFVLDDLVRLYRSFTFVEHDVGLEVKHGLEVTQRDVKQVADARRQALEEPYVRTRRCELDVPEPLAADFGKRYFHAALVADDSAMLHALVLAAEALPVSDRAEDARAEQAIALRLEGTVVDGLR